MEEAGFIEVDTVRLEYRRWTGLQPPILLMHEALGSISIWRNFPDKLAHATGHEVVAWSRQGHGGSDRPVAPRLADYLNIEAKIVLQVMDALAIKKAHFFGHSDGATIAILAAALAPERVVSLVLEAPHVNVEQGAVDGIVVARRAYETTDFRPKLARHHRDVDHVFWSWHDVWVSVSFQDWNIEQCLAQIQIPALVIQGLKDEYFSMGQAELIVAGLPEAQLLALENCGHSPHRDQEGAVLRAVIAFINDAKACVIKGPKNIAKTR
ncbi:alpha/beta fold hydrolase [Glaciimonas immobilis]|uniref:Pimeloyl-ACP methyl ester carboxylesterase n=1 Tax=Glaciimonas immobilis TaxID=728004 RepID=A0A840RUL3_9BURK|nr:alpha/beta hydrolase [Glaciimonas immobilis]KAF3996761.1 alpha/beta hydrolase [Glaciimonas immobilis]MBB5201313.1 pimeloyl-ACP methyl ester carboxylesterase [Glaciimonas immobilis]